jgi:hypothetical protein
VVAGIGADWQATLVFGAGLVVSLLLLVLGRDEQRNEKCRHCHRVIRPRAGGGLTLKVPVDRLV